MYQKNKVNIKRVLHNQDRVDDSGEAEQILFRLMLENEKEKTKKLKPEQSVEQALLEHWEVGNKNTAQRR